MNGRSLEEKLNEAGFDSKLSELCRLYEATILPDRINIFDEFLERTRNVDAEFICFY